MPGDEVLRIAAQDRDDEPVRLGHGLVHHVDQDTGDIVVRATRAGLLEQRQPRAISLRTPMRRYIAAQGDFVVGQVMFRHSEGYRIDIGTAQMANLGMLAFGEQTTKRFKPSLQVGDVVYARISFAHRDVETELECFDARTGKAGPFGQLAGGYVVDGLNLEATAALFRGKVRALERLGSQFAFELCVGVNGRVWIKTDDFRHTMIVKTIVENCYGKSNAELSALLDQQLLDLAAE